MINVILLAIKSLVVKLLMALISEKMLEWAFFKTAELIAAHTKTPHDDEWVQKLKESYERVNK